MRSKHITNLFLCILLSFNYLNAQNLILNPDCELPFVNGVIPNWTKVSGNWQAKEKVPTDQLDPAAQSGRYYFFAGGGKTAELSQIVNLSNYSCYTDFSKMQYQFTAYVRSYPQNPPDEARIILEFLNQNGAVLSSYDSGVKNEVATWLKISATLKAPINTRQIRIRLISTRKAGEDNDGYFDNLSLVAVPNFVNLAFDTIKIKPATCGESNASLTVSMKGGSGVYIYSLDSRTFMPDSLIKNLYGGDVKVTVLDTNGCYISKEVTIPRFLPPAIQSVETKPSTCSRNNGSITINAVGGTGRLSYSLNTGAFQVNRIFDTLMGGSYTVRVKDSLECIVSKNVALNDMPPPKIENIIATPTTCGKTNGSIQVITSGGTEPVLFSINGSEYSNNAIFNNLDKGSYTIAVKDSNSCLVAQKATVTTTQPIVITAIEVAPSVCGKSSGAITIKASGGLGALVYGMDNDFYQKENVFANLQKGKYTIVVKDSSDCQADSTVVVQSDCGIFVPNIFSPNGDGNNDFLGFYGDDSLVEKVLTYKIFNRWGNLIYDNPDVKMNSLVEGWDGKLNGNYLQNDVYIYIIEVQLKDGKYLQKKGDVLLMR